VEPGGLKTVRFDRAGAVATITLNRSDLLNPLDQATVADVHTCLDAIERAADIEIVLLRGAGRAFSAGGDLKWAIDNHRDRALMKSLGDALRDVLVRIEASPRLFVAVIEGLCVAGGVELMLACDYVMATARAKFSDGHLNISLLPGAGGTQRMPRLIGMLKAKDLMLTARMLDAAEAHALGLVTTVVPVAELDAQLDALTETLTAKSFSSRAAIKHLVNRGAEMDRVAALAFEADFVLDYESGHSDAHEGLLAFQEKRAPRFSKP
jgi:enoyl-CoA hydratase